MATIYDNKNPLRQFNVRKKIKDTSFKTGYFLMYKATFFW